MSSHWIGFALLMVIATGGVAVIPVQVTGAEPAQELPAWASEGFGFVGEVEVLVELVDDDVEAEATALRKRRGIVLDDEEVLAVKTRGFAHAKARVLLEVEATGITLVTDFSHLPISLVRLRSPRSFQRLAAHPQVRAVFPNEKIYPHLAQSLPLISQSLPVALGHQGAGVAIAIIDTGIDYRKTTFGSCTAPGVPTGCRVPAMVELATADGQLDDIGHGTHVAGIAATVAPHSSIVALDVFNPDGSSTEALVIQGINWAIANRSLYNIGVINMSLGNGTKYTSPCSNKATNPFVTPIASVRAAGIVPIASAGNEGFVDGISRPACTPGVVSVGAVYDANVGGLAWSACTDYTTAADKVTCFSNGAYFLTLLAPGAVITVDGLAKGGTSQAAPHVAGAAAVMHSAFPAETPDQVTARLVAGGTPVTDPRNGLSIPRLNLTGALGAPPNDLWLDRLPLAGENGSLTATNVNSGKEPGEADHAGNPGGRSVWWQLTPTIPGLFSIDTHGSGFDTLLAVYEEVADGGLTLVAVNDNDGFSNGAGSVTFVGEAGKNYSVVVDGYNGAAGLVDLTWNRQAAADLTVTIADSLDPATVGTEVRYDITVVNLGPSLATGVTMQIPLAPGTALLAMSPGCSAVGDLLTCASGDLGAGDTSTVWLSVANSVVGPMEVSAAVSSEVIDPNPANNSAVATTEIVALPPAEPVPALSAVGIAGTLLSVAVMLRRHTTHRRFR